MAKGRRGSGMLRSSRRGRDLMRVTTVVLGDLARSPRMQYHAEALARSAADVDVGAYADEVPAAVLADRSRITIHPLSSGRARPVPRALFIPYTALRVLA